MNGFVPTIHDPAIRDLRLLARAVAHHLELAKARSVARTSAMPIRTGKLAKIVLLLLAVGGLYLLATHKHRQRTKSAGSRVSLTPGLRRKTRPLRACP
jgi:hypothetical protein